MKWKHLWMALILVPCLHCTAFAELRPKLGLDERHEAIKDKTFIASSTTFNWDMATTWLEIIHYFDIAVHFCDSVRMASGGRLTITPYPAGEILPAAKVLDAVQNGTVEAGFDWPGYWRSKDEAFGALASVPFGLNQEGMNLWLFEHNGTKQAQELYAQSNIYSLPCGQGGAELGLFSTTRIASIEDFQGLKARALGWFGDILAHLGANIATDIPASKMSEALSNGTLDAAEFSDPVINYTFGFDEAAGYTFQPGVHQPLNQFFVLFNQQQWNALPPDLQAIVTICAKETQLWSRNWLTKWNMVALETLRANMTFEMMNERVQSGLATATQNHLQALRAQNENLDRILRSQEELHNAWSFWRTVEHECYCCNPLSDCQGDFDHDQDVDGSDLATFAREFGRTDCLK
jgi:TRAP-type mannitol/chloroaromatic compound transport system substrate-binding protein